MKKRNLFFGLLTTTFLISGFSANAQIGDLFQKAKDKAAKKASQMMDKPADQQADNEKKSKKLIINSGFDYAPGDSVIFADDFARIPDGSSVHSIKTNGTATVVSIKDEAGKWLVLEQDATYKLTKQLFYPRHFTVEFDLLAVSDRIKDIYPAYIGFTKDNSVRDYNSGDGAYLDLKYYNDNDVSVNSSYVDKYLTTAFDLSPYNNQKMHVSISVDGERMTVYLDKTKLADTQLFLPGSAKNFYISAPSQYSNGAKLLASNFKIAMFKSEK